MRNSSTQKELLTPRARAKTKRKRPRGFREYLIDCLAKTTIELRTRRRALRPQIADAMSELGAVETELNRRKGGTDYRPQPAKKQATNPDDDLYPVTPP